MNIYKSAQWGADIDVVLFALPELNALRGKSVLVTGACGLICSAVVDVFIRYNESHDTPIVILAAARSEEKIKLRFREYSNSPYFHFIPYDAISPKVEIDKKVDYIIHGASNASPNKIVKEPVETMLSNFNGLLALLNFAKSSETNRLLYVSSSEVYGKKEQIEPYMEGEYGFVDLLNSRNSYSVSKRAAETLCVSYADEYGVKSVIVRPGHIYGPTASETDNRVSSAWAYDVAYGKNIILKSDGTQIRSYVYCLDCVSAIIKVLINGKCGNAYNISNPNSIISIREMAEILCKSANVQLRLELPTDDDKKGFNPMNNSSLYSVSLQELGWEGYYDAKTGFFHTVQIIKESLC